MKIATGAESVKELSDRLKKTGPTQHKRLLSLIGAEVDNEIIVHNNIDVTLLRLYICQPIELPELTPDEESQLWADAVAGKDAEDAEDWGPAGGEESDGQSALTPEALTPTANTTPEAQSQSQYYSSASVPSTPVSEVTNEADGAGKKFPICHLDLIPTVADVSNLFTHDDTTLSTVELSERLEVLRQFERENNSLSLGKDLCKRIRVEKARLKVLIRYR